ncbi:MAG: isoaspartyl peptidase/L-asparaginase [Gammaproteobacteria bacterium]
MNKFGIAIHGGAGNETPFLTAHLKEYEASLQEALQIGYDIVKAGGAALDAVQAAVMNLEDNPLFNAGRGSALDAKGEIEMDAAIMDGREVAAGAVSMVRYVKNPILLARTIMSKTKHVFLSGYGALEFAKINELSLEPESYFVTDHEYAIFLNDSKDAELQHTMEKKVYGSTGTVGAVALDQAGNIAAATSTGGISNSLPGRIGDSCVIGAGCYANNRNCAVSGTGIGEILITDVIAHTIAMSVEFKQYPLQKACDYVILERDRPKQGSIGVIAIDKAANIGISFSSEIMKRAWMTSEQAQPQVKIYP